MSISELTGKIFTNTGKEVIIFSLLAGNEGGGHIKYLFLSLCVSSDRGNCSGRGNPHNLSAAGSSNDCEGASFMLVTLFIGFNMKVAQLRPTLCNPMDSRLPGSSVLGILQANTWVGCHALL